MELKVSLPHSQNPPPVPILSQINPVLVPHAIPLREYPSSCYPPIYAWIFQVVIFFLGFPHQNPVCTSRFPPYGSLYTRVTIFLLLWLTT